MLSYIKTFVAKLTIYKSDFYRLSLNMFAVYSHDLETFSFNQELVSSEALCHSMDHPHLYIG